MILVKYGENVVSSNEKSYTFLPVFSTGDFKYSDMGVHTTNSKQRLEVSGECLIPHLLTNMELDHEEYYSE